MRALPRVAAGVLTLAIAALFATGYGQSTEDAEAALCADLAALRSSVQTLADTNAMTSVDEYQQSVENVAGEDSLAAAKADIAADVATFDETRSDIFSGLGCATNAMEDSNG